jgi:hypothetical protein
MEKAKPKKIIIPYHQTIFQCYVSSTLKSFGNEFKKKYNLGEYYSVIKPTIFFGCYNEKDLQILHKHAGFKVLIWGGSDCDYVRQEKAKKNLQVIKKNPKIKHLAISDYIKNDLTHFGIPCKRITLCFTPFYKFAPFKKGEFIYFYTSLSNPILYGCDILKSLFEEFKKQKKSYKFIITTSKKQQNFKTKFLLKKFPFLKHAIFINPEKIIGIYKHCFLGLRLTKHDGNANTVQELGMCGIKCCYNGDENMPNALKWKTTSDLVNIINNESKTIGTIDEKLSVKVKKYLSPNKSWLNKNYYI